MFTAYLTIALMILFGLAILWAGIKLRTYRKNAEETWPRSSGTYIRQKKDASLDFLLPYVEYEFEGIKHGLLNHLGVPNSEWCKKEIIVLVHPLDPDKSIHYLPKYLYRAPLALLLTGSIFFVTSLGVLALMIFVM
jgi:hypothetical protein